MRNHTLFGEAIFTGQDEVTQMARDIAGGHHEHWDGSGYPYGLQGEKIPLAARVCAIADVFDALTTPRHYARLWPFDEAARFIIGQAGSFFDPTLVGAFEAGLPEISRIKDLYMDVSVDPREPFLLTQRHQRTNSWFAWDASFNSGIDIIDEQHQYLFDLVNELHDAIADHRSAYQIARAIKALELYADVHFKKEKQIKANNNVRMAEKISVRYNRFKYKMLKFKNLMHDDPLVDGQDILSFLHSWLMNHVRVAGEKANSQKKYVLYH
jgi:hemerythrin-like metal-binding protein